jgi:hypothetical protein
MSNVEPWDIDWYECCADVSDVDYQNTKKLKKGEARRDLKIGDVMWRVPRGIGPIYTDHNHWAGYHLGIDEELAHRIARLPVLEEALRQIRGLATSSSPAVRSSIYGIATDALGVNQNPNDEGADQ